MPAKPKGEKTQAELAALAGVSVRSLRIWEKEGVNVYDEQALLARAAKVEKRQSDSEDYNTTKHRKLKAEADLKEHELEVERGKFVSKEEVLREGMKMGLAVKSMLQKAESELTPRLAGRKASEVSKVLKEWSRDKMVELSLYDSPIKVTVD